jgi:hypothetical protein
MMLVQYAHAMKFSFPHLHLLPFHPLPKSTQTKPSPPKYAALNLVNIHTILHRSNYFALPFACPPFGTFPAFATGILDPDAREGECSFSSGGEVAGVWTASDGLLPTRCWGVEIDWLVVEVLLTADAERERGLLPGKESGCWTGYCWREVLLEEEGSEVGTRAC